MNNKKIVFEIIIIPLCILYLILSFLKSPTAGFIIFTVVAVITAIWFVPKYFNEVYVYESKKNYLKIGTIVSYIGLCILSILNLFISIKVLKILLIVFACLVFIHLIYYFIKNLKEVMTLKKEIGIYILNSFFSLLFFAIMLSTLIICLK